MTTRSAAEAPQDTQGQYRDASGHLKDTLDGYMDLVETLRRLTDGVYRSLFLSRISAYLWDIYDNIKVSWWELETTGYVDPNAYKRVKVSPLAR